MTVYQGLYGSAPAGSYSDLYDPSIPSSFKPIELVGNWKFTPYDLTDYPVLWLNNTGVENGWYIDQVGILGGSKSALYLTSDTLQTTGLGLGYFSVNNSSSTIPAVNLHNIGYGSHLRMNGNANVSTLSDGDMAYDGTHLYFKPSGTVVDLLNSTPTGNTNTIAVNEVPSGTPNGVLTDFVVDYTIVVATSQVYRDGQMMTRGDDYTEVAPKTIRFTTAPTTGSVILVTYQYALTIMPGSAIWGEIIGTLSDQTDLNDALLAKQNQLNGTGFVKAVGTTVSYDNSTYLTTAVTSVKKTGEAALTGAVTLSGGTNVTLTQSGNDISIAAVGGSSTNNPLYYQVRAASTANVVIASALENGDSLDGVTLATGDKVLLKNQTTASENGVYVAVATGAGAASRATDFNTDLEIRSSKVLVQEGTANAGFIWACGNTSAITVGSTSIIYNRTFLEIIQANLTITVNPSGGGDFTSLAAAYTFINSFGISANAIVTIQGVDAIENASTTLSISHPDYAQIRVTGVSVAKSLQSVVSSSGSSRNFSYVLQLNDNSGITTSHFLYVPAFALPTGGVLPEYLCGVYEITNVGASNQITIKSYQFDTNLASGAVSATVYILKTVYNYTTASSIAISTSSISGIFAKDMVFKYTNPAVLSGNIFSLNGYTYFDGVGILHADFGCNPLGWYVGTGNNAFAISNCNKAIAPSGTIGVINYCIIHGCASSTTGALRLFYAGLNIQRSVICNNNFDGVLTTISTGARALGGMIIAGNNGYGIKCTYGSSVETNGSAKIYRNVTNDVYAEGNSVVKLVSSQTITGTVTNGANTVTSSDTSRLYVGARVSDTNIPANTTVASITSATAWTMSNNATPGSGAVTITVKPRVSPAVNTISLTGGLIIE